MEPTESLPAGADDPFASVTYDAVADALLGVRRQLEVLAQVSERIAIALEARVAMHAAPASVPTPTPAPAEPRAPAVNIDQEKAKLEADVAALLAHFEPGKAVLREVFGRYGVNRRSDVRDADVVAVREALAASARAAGLAL
jgi:hypothetical protein